MWLEARQQEVSSLTCFERLRSSECSYHRVARDNFGVVQRFVAVTPGQSSVRNGDAGKPDLLERFTIGLSAQP